MDILEFQPSIHLPPDVTHSNPVWSSPLCTHYSVMKQCNNPATEEQLRFSDTLVRKALQIAEELGCPILVENPWTGRLKTRGILDHLTMHRVDYCKYSRPDKKPTSNWTHTDWKPARPLCQHDWPATLMNNETIVEITSGLSQVGSMPNQRRSPRNSVRRSQSSFPEHPAN